MDNKNFLTELKSALEAGLSHAEARERCFEEIAKNPGNKFARLLLAKLFYLDSYEEFVVRELLELTRRYPSPSLEALIRSFGPIADQYRSSTSSDDRKTSTHGELDFDFSIFDEDEK
jgi:hypothetical protein